MSSHFSRHRSWLCRLADKLGVVADIRSGDGGASDVHGPDRGRGPEHTGGRGAVTSWQNLLRGPLRRHVSQCPRCRSERAEWSRVIARLQEVDRPAAPDSLFDGLMARIAEERAEQYRTRIGSGVDLSGAVPPIVDDPSDRDPVFADVPIGGEVHWLVPVMAVAAALSLVAVPAANVANTVRYAVGMTLEATRVVILDVLEHAFRGVASLGTSSWPGDHLAVGLIWCLIGLGITVAVSVVSGTIAQD